MKFRANDCDYYIQFEHVPPSGLSHEVTACYIVTRVPDGTPFGTDVVILSGVVERYYRDAYDKELGRKKALAAALKPWPKATREIAWRTYLGRKGAREVVGAS